MKIYHLVIAYNEDTEEIEYINEEVEDLTMPSSTSFIVDLEDGYFDQDMFEYLASENQVGEA